MVALGFPFFELVRDDMLLTPMDEKTPS